jgi:hypothetical protein
MFHNEPVTLEHTNMKNDLHYEILRSRGEFLSLKSVWERIFNENHETNFYLSFDWFSFLVNHKSNHFKNLYIITVFSGADVIAIIPSYIKLRRQCFLRHNSLELIGNIYSPYRGCLVKSGVEGEVAEGLVDFLLSRGSEDWRLIFFEGLSDKNPFIHALNDAIKGHNLFYYKEDQFPNIVCDISPFQSSENYFRSLKRTFRDPIKRHINMMNRDGAFDILLFHEEHQDIERCMDDYYDIYAKSWKKKEGDPLFHRELARYLVKKGLLRIFILYMTDNNIDADKEVYSPVLTSYQSSINPDCPILPKVIPVALCLFILFGRHAFFLKTSYREDYAKYGPGITLMWFSFKYLLDVEHVQIIDYQRDFEPYKISFGGKIHEIRFQLLIGNPRSYLVSVDLKCRETLVQLLRKLKGWGLSILRGKKHHNDD